ncbi:hypothetical protein [Methanoregula sp.]|uniref:hypothetical protein n=1 Tax=Methanoregula sp. TaxID=2052170 RepID=UPI00237452D0|nr:hypothetical protein [Methanoregula sp.]MDD1687597.1 hypothetical protein [Methanoregula sp.]
MFEKINTNTIIIPGMLFGILYPVIFFVTMTYLEPTLPSGLKGGFLSLTMVFLIAPALLVIAGALSEILHQREPRSGRVLPDPYCAGFLGVFVACNLIMAVFSANQYVPYLEPGLMPRLAFVTGYAIFIFPVVMLVSAVFAGLSLAGSWLMHRRSEVAEKTSTIKEQI